MEGVNGAEWKGARRSFSGLVAGSKGTACSCAGLRFRASLFAATGRALSKSCASFVLLLLLGVLGLILPQLRAEAQTLAGPVVTETRLPPNSLTDLVGTHTGSVTALDTKDQTGTQNDPTKYVQFGVPSGQQYLGYQSFVVPTTISLSQVTSLQLMANVPPSDAFTWSIYNWSTASYETLGNQNNCGGVTGLHTCSADGQTFANWKWLQYNALGATLTNYVNSTTREIRLQLASSNASSYINVDWESVAVYSNKGAGAIFQPPVVYRWQYQLSSNATLGSQFPVTQGINVNVCQVPFTGGACVTPDIIDFDFYEDQSISGTNSFVYTTGAVQALHSSGRKAIGYVDAGDIEKVRPDYQQYVDFDNACSGCLIGNPFSGFRGEFMLNINNDKGQADFIRKMTQARTDRVAANGFDSVEYDVISNYQNKSGFTISYQTQEDFNVSLTKIAHSDGLSVPLKSDNGQAQDALTISSFDFVIDEQCNQYSFCNSYTGFQSAGKAIFNVEYKVSTSKVCPTDNSMNFNGIYKGVQLYDLPWNPCR